jgi:hypothetical protein
MTSRVRLQTGLVFLASWILTGPVRADGVRLPPSAARVPPVVGRFEQSSASVERFDFVEVTLVLERPAKGNPFTEATLTGQLAPPGGGSFRVDGFCDSADGRVFRIRFMPTVEGRHRYSLTFRNDRAVLRHAGEFTSIRGKRPGPVRIDPDHPFHFVRQGTGAHWFWNGTTTYLLLAWDDETIAASVNRLAGLGVNRLRVALCARQKDGTRWNEPLVQRTEKFSFKVEPWQAARPDDIADPGYDVTRFNLDLFHKAERMLRLARERDVMISIIFYLDGADPGVDPFGKTGMGGADEERYYRYVAARFAAYANAMWDLTNEYHLFRNEAWVNQMGTFLSACDPYAHLMSVHGHNRFPFRTEPWADFAMYQSWDEHGGYQFMLNNRREQEKTHRPMPQINEEYGYEDHYPYPWGEGRLWPARTADNRRRLAWEITMAGGYQTTGERANDGTGTGLDSGGGWINGRGDPCMTLLVGYGHLRRFFEGFAWWKLEPHPDLLRLPPEPNRTPREKRPAASPVPVLLARPVCLAEPGERYVLYLPQGGNVRMMLDGGPYRGRWFNPRTGRFEDGKIETGSGEWTSPAAPDAEDWVLLLERTPSRNKD